VGNRAVRWVNIRNIHLTLKFLGDISPNQLDLLKQTLIVEARQAAPFSLDIGALGAFPNPRRPRVIWIGLQAPAALASLHRGLESALARVGYPPESKPFTPHLTIGRVSPKATTAEIQSLCAGLEETTIAPIGSVDIDTLHLFKSDLQPTGPIYTRLFSAKFGV